MECIKNVTDDDFETEVLERSREVPVVVDFWAEWCGPCRVLGPILEKLAVEANGKFVLAKIDVDRSPRRAQAFGVRGIPQVMAFRNGRVASEFTGAIPEEAVRQFLRNVIPSEADGLSTRGGELREEDPAAAEALYREAVAAEPGHQVATLGLAELLVARGDVEEAESVVEQLVPGGPLGERVEQVSAELRIRRRMPDAAEADLRKKVESETEPGPVLVQLGNRLAGEKRYPEALEILLRAAESSPELARGEAKEIMVDIFHVIGVRSSLADDYRTKISRLLY